jgi:hypothetical protein
MTRAKAVKKANELTKRTGQEHRAWRDARMPGGWGVRNVEKQRASQRAENMSPEQRAGRFVRNARTRSGAQFSVTAQDIAALRASQGERCPFTDRPLDEIKTVVDHAWDDTASGAGSLRGVIHTKVNPALGRTDSDLFDFASRVTAYAGRRRRVLIVRMCARPRKRTKISKKTLAKLRTAVRKAGS